jgi:galactose mutarotase-like enzyme
MHPCETARMPQGIDVQTLDIRAGDDVATIAPGRGAIVTRWHAAGREQLYLDESTLPDLTKNVRGGVPLLFPSPGKLEGDKFSRAGHTGALKQHGFARDLPWQRASAGPGEAKLSLASIDRTRAVYPWDFEASVTFTIAPSRLRLAFSVRNTAKEPMPFAFGTHPYFRVTDKARATIPTRATRAFDNVTKKEIPFTGFDLTRPEVDLHLVDHGSDGTSAASGGGVVKRNEATLDRGDGSKVTITGSPEFTRWVVWTVAGKDFVCLEPWTAPGNALNTGESLFSLEPGTTKELWLEFVAG